MTHSAVDVVAPGRRAVHGRHDAVHVDDESGPHRSILSARLDRFDASAAQVLEVLRDLVFPGARVACFVDGDRWHGNGWRTRGFASFEEEFAHRNSDFWKQKIARNMARDVEVTCQLQAKGWLVVRVWASEIEADLTSVADRVERSVLDRRTRPTR